MTQPGKQNFFEGDEDPSPPTSGYLSVFAKNDGTLNTINSSGTVTTLGGGGGGGSPGGGDRAIQFNNAGSFGGSSLRYQDDGSNSSIELFADDTSSLMMNSNGYAATFRNDGDGNLFIENLNSSTTIQSNSNLTLQVNSSLLMATNNLLVFDSFFSEVFLSFQPATKQLALLTEGAGLGIQGGVNCKIGTATLTGGTVAVSNTSITAQSRIFTTIQNANGGTPGAVYLSNVVPGVGFDIQSTSGSDTSTVAYNIIEEIV